METQQPVLPDDSLKSLPRTSLYRKLNSVYGLFAYLAIASMVCGFLPILPIDQQALAGYEFLFGLPLAVSAMFAVPVGAVMAVKYRREWPLPVMAAACIVLFVIVVLEIDAPSDSPVLLAGFAATTTILVFFTVRWYAVVRKRIRAEEARNAQAELRHV